jgi:Flp pilus assembly protein TadG
MNTLTRLSTRSAGDAGVPAPQAASNLSQLCNGKVEKVFRMCRKKRRGAAVVEFAVVAPVFITLVFGMIEYGRMVMVQQMLTNGSREGARVGVLDGTTTSEVQSAVTTYLSNAGITGSTVTVTPNPPSSAGYGAPVTVTVTVPFSQVSWLPTPMFLSGKTLTATSVMRRETVQ